MNFLIGGKAYSFLTEQNPVSTETASTLNTTQKEYIRTSGAIKPGHPLNQTKETPSDIDILDEGMAEITDIKPDFMKVRVKGKKFSGLFSMVQEKGTNIWTVSRESYEKMDNSLQYQDFQITKRTLRQDGRMEVEGLLFTPGTFKGKTYKYDVVKNAVLEPIHRGTNLAYINLFHHRDEISRIGILTDIWWDSEFEWFCNKDKKKMKGALMFRGIISDKESFDTILKDGTYQVSAEVAFDVDASENPRWMAICGMAVCHTPAVVSAQILKACVSGNCRTFPQGTIPAQI